MKLMVKRIIASLLLSLLLLPLSVTSLLATNLQTRIVGGSESNPTSRPYFTALMGRSIHVTVRGNSYIGGLMNGSASNVAESILIDCGSGFDPCVGVNGNICLIERGDTFFRDKALNCQQAGGIGAIIYNNVPGSFSGNLDAAGATSNDEITIPVASVSQQAGATMLQDTFRAARIGLPDSSVCGGVYIGKGWVLTAGHCVYDDVRLAALTVPPSNPANGITVNIGGHDLTTDQNNVIGLTEIRMSEHYRLVDSNPDDDDPGVPTDDFALLKLVKEPENIQPVSAATAEMLQQAIDSGDLGTAIGRGYQQVVAVGTDTPQFEVKKVFEVDMPFIPNSVCRTVYGNVIDSSMVCAGTARAGEGTCQGDSGGPILINRGGVDYVAGLTSFGSGCAAAGFYDVYARVPAFLTEINDALGLPPPTEPKDPGNGDNNPGDGDQNSGGGSFGFPMLFLLLVIHQFKRTRVY